MFDGDDFSRMVGLFDWEMTGAGRSFSAGGDVKTMGKYNQPLQIYRHIGKLNELILAMQDLDKPIIACAAHKGTLFCHIHAVCRLRHLFGHLQMG